ncbi:5-methylcytosine-specific restriction endonuclease McrA [Methanococcus voltae]|uniref:HNH endonuclease n=1 Tax=Methanococcus voltae TaxID=2188 RepID=UPI001AE86DF2|nr:HNH endonuclease [Methanococcus voltae]MBP2143936.1 5-methylcytosine-specific restriction endonuclease McrA [Methanococcus voltae]
MPDKEVKTVEDMIYYQYAKIMAKSASRNGKKMGYGFIKTKFRNLKSGKISWSSIMREDLQFVGSEKKCIYCGCTENLTKDHIIPKSINVNERCKDCDNVQGIHNIIWACKSCNSKKGKKGLYEVYDRIYPDDDKFFDKIPSLVEKKYLKLVYRCCSCANKLDYEIDPKDGSVLDIDYCLKEFK